MFHDAGKPSPVSGSPGVARSQTVSGLAGTLPSIGRRLQGKAVPALTGVLLALAVSTSTANAAEFDDGPGYKAIMCPAIGCGDGSRECAKAVGTVQSWLFMPIMPYLIPIEYTITVTCYEEPMQ